MAIRHSTSSGRTPRNRRRSSPLGGAAKPIRLRGTLKAFLESERDALVSADSLLKCIAQAMECGTGPSGPYYPDVIGLAVNLLKRRAANLDELLLDGRLPVVAQYRFPTSD